MSDLQGFAEEQVEDHEGLVRIGWERICMISNGRSRSHIEQKRWGTALSKKQLPLHVSDQRLVRKTFPRRLRLMALT